MKRFFIILLTISIIVLIIPVFLMKRQTIDVQELDVVEVNELLFEIEKNWDSTSKSYPECSFGYAILNEDEELIYSRRGEHQASSIVSATKERDVMRDIIVDDQKVGTLIIYNYINDIEYMVGQKMLKNYFVAAGFVLVLILATFIWIWVRVVMPFDKMKDFATAVSSGDLDRPLEMDKGNVFGAFTESFDIMREELKSSREREEAALRSRKELVAELSHDIKTPVASIKAMAEVMSLTAKTDAEKETIAAIDGKADQIDRLISNLFHATLEELEQLEVKVEEVDSTELVRMVKEADHLKKVGTLDIKDAVLLGDKMRLNQVISNIIYNSYKYADTEITVSSRFDKTESPQNGSDGTVNTRKTTSENYLVIEISDKGGGVPDDEIDVIMEKFHRGSNSAGKDGSGLGLYISNYLMEKMGGGLSCRNGEDGLIVTLRIKVA